MQESATERENPGSNVTTGAEGAAPSLVGLRLLMEEGVRRSSERSPVGRRIAIVILDGAVEAAIGVCLSNFGQDFGDKLEADPDLLTEIRTLLAPDTTDNLTL